MAIQNVNVKYSDQLANTQAYLNLRFAHASEGTFPDVAAVILSD